MNIPKEDMPVLAYFVSAFIFVALVSIVVAIDSNLQRNHELEMAKVECSK